MGGQGGADPISPLLQCVLKEPAGKNGICRGDVQMSLIVWIHNSEVSIGKRWESHQEAPAASESHHVVEPHGGTIQQLHGPPPLNENRCMFEFCY